MPVVVDWNLALGAQPSVLAFLVAIMTTPEMYFSAMALGTWAVAFERMARLGGVERPAGVFDIGVQVCTCVIAAVIDETVKASRLVGALGAVLLAMSAVTAVPVALGAGCLGLCWSLRVGVGLGRQVENFLERPRAPGESEPRGRATIPAAAGDREKGTPAPGREP